MSLLSFENPKKVRTTEDHNKFCSSDCGVEGTFVPNMSDEDNNKWKGKHIKGDNERIEIRKSFGTQLVIVVYKESFKNGQIKPEYPEYNFDDYPNGYSGFREKRDKYDEWHKGYHDDIKISMNGSLSLSNSEYNEMIQVIQEAKDYMNNK